MITHWARYTSSLLKDITNKITKTLCIFGFKGRSIKNSHSHSSQYLFTLIDSLYSFKFWFKPTKHFQELLWQDRSKAWSVHYTVKAVDMKDKWKTNIQFVPHNIRFPFQTFSVLLITATHQNLMHILATELKTILHTL